MGELYKSIYGTHIELCSDEALDNLVMKFMEIFSTSKRELAKV
jgi:hypothetical protein